MAKKKPKKGGNPHFEKKPRSPSLENPLDLNPVWQISRIDLEGPWGWTNIDKKLFFDKIIPRIKNFESMTWSNIIGKRNHPIPISKIAEKAQKRLAELNMDDSEYLISLRFMSRERMWGIRVHNTLKILWWDPNHEVYPVSL